MNKGTTTWRGRARRVGPNFCRNIVRYLLAIAFGASISSLALAKDPESTRTVTGIDRITYFDADIRDAEFCNVTVAGRHISYGKNVTNPAMTCPDAFSWALFAQAVSEEFWSNWANEVQNWPKEPWPMCSAAGQQKCCDPTRAVNDRTHCPVFPGNDLAAEQKKMAPLLMDTSPALAADSGEKIFTQLRKESPALLRVGSARQHMGATPALSSEDIKQAPECSQAQIQSWLPKDPQSVGRWMRQLNSEQTTRNLAFHRYLFENDLYNADGVEKVFNRNDDIQKKYSPYHAANDKKVLTTIDLPPSAIMIKANWVSEKVIIDIKNRFPGIGFGKPEDYIRDSSFVTEVNLPDNKQCIIGGTHYLMSFHISSKDIPQWVWTTFEHKGNSGRCDYTGCNDSFGYLNPVVLDGTTEPDIKSVNFIAPHQRWDQLAAPAIVFDPDATTLNPLQKYPEGLESSALSEVLAAYGIGNGANHVDQDHRASAGDSAWKNYRLKGSQTEFTDRQGRPTLLGNSITEAGFMGTSSCIGCHARAGFAPVGGKAPAQFLRLGVFEPVLSDFGYQQSHMGVPNHAWYYNDSPTFGLEVLQTDFIWGFLNAKFIDPAKNSNN